MTARVKKDFGIGYFFFSADRTDVHAAILYARISFTSCVIRRSGRPAQCSS